MQAQAVYATQGMPLRNQIERLLDRAPTEEAQGHVHAVIVPNSNLLEGGEVSARVFAAIRNQPCRYVVVVAPSLSGTFKRLNVCSLDRYRTPLGEVPISAKLRDELCDEDDDIFVGDEGHFHTHGADAQLPFLQSVFDEFEIVPIVMGNEEPDLCRELGHAIGEIMYNRTTLLVACTSILEGSAEDVALLRQRLEDRDVSGLMALVNSDRMEIQGKGALLVALMASMRRNAKHVTVTDCTAPEGRTPGFLGAYIT